MAEPTGPTRPTGPNGPEGPRRVDPAAVPERVTMPLLTLITQQSLDEDYQHAADRKAAGGGRPGGSSARPVRVAAVVVLLFGLLAATAFVQTARNADVASASRATLITRIEAASDRRARQEERAAALRTRITQLERSVRTLTDDDQTESTELRRLQVRTGFIPVSGEGVRYTVTPAPGADKTQEIQDKDLRLLVNGLWEAGAEAISVNGQRMAATSAVRNSGAAIQVNLIGVEAPFVVEAVGDNRTIPARFAESTTGQYFVSNAEIYGFTYTVENVDDLRLPAAPAARERLRFSRVQTNEDETIDRGGTG